MRTMKMMFIGAAVAIAAGPAFADVVSDRAAAILVWSDVKYIENNSVDTIIQVSNTSQEPVLAHCFYENANSHCSHNGTVCQEASDCCNPSSNGCGTCKPGWLETDFRIRLTPRQPLGWVASEGRTEFPLDGRFGNVGPDGSSNAGSRIPPVAEQPYTGSLRCIAINDDGTPSDRNVLKGESTHVYPETGDVAKHNAIGIQALEGAVNDDKELILGGGEAEYNGCSNILILNHMFDLGIHPAIDTEDAESLTNLVLVPCTNDYLRQVPGRAVIQFLVYNEFEQRFSTSRTADCKADWRLSEIDTNDPQRSIFSAGVGGSLVGQTRMNPIGSGFVGVANEWVTRDAMDSSSVSRSSFNIHMQGDRAEADVITIP